MEEEFVSDWIRWYDFYGSWYLGFIWGYDFGLQIYWIVLFFFWISRYCFFGGCCGGWDYVWMWFFSNLKGDECLVVWSVEIKIY